MATVYRFAFHFLRNHQAAEDVAQEAMLRAWKNRESLKKVTSARSWLLRITSNLCRDYLRREAIKPTQNVARPNELLQRPSTFDSESNEQLDQIKRAIDALPVDYRQVVYLASIEGLTINQIAEITGDRAGTVKVRLSRARAKLRRLLVSRGILKGGQP